MSHLVYLLKDRHRFVKEADLKLIASILARSKDLHFLDKQELPLLVEIEMEYKKRIQERGRAEDDRAERSPSSFTNSQT